MRLKSKNNNIMYLITAIFSYISAGISLLSLIIFAFNLFGMTDLYSELIITYVSPDINVSSQVSMMCIELGFMVLTNWYFGNFYLKGWKYKITNREYGRATLMMGIFQLFAASFIPAVLGIITGAILMNRKSKIVVELQESGDPTQPRVEPNFMPEYKLNAMSEAVNKLKALRNSGAISEEEYYATLNKILES